MAYSTPILQQSNNKKCHIWPCVGETIVTHA